ncbi:MAG: acetoacetyl-CoA reductase [Alphaproteobacteria bacterium]|nr:acetoacetyl-CoA reductase [Alphaproteobacteria bacterium]
MSKVALVTGGTRGIGLAISMQLKEDGFQVVAIYHGNEEAAEKFRADTKCHAYKADVSNYEDCKAVFEKIKEEVGAIEILVNNAGITRDSTLHKMKPENWHAVIETNLTSCFYTSHIVINGMRERGFGRIINISSINGQKGQFGQTNYSAAKAGMIGFTKALALEGAAKGITVNAVCPGYIETDMTSAINKEVLDSIIRQIPITRMGKPEEIAAAVSFLASDKAAFITGATLSINGGQYMA